MSKYEVLKYSLDLSVSNSNTFISGSNEISAVVTSSPLDTFCVDLIKTVVPTQTYMVVDSLFINSQKCKAGAMENQTMTAISASGLDTNRLKLEAFLFRQIL